MTNEHTMMEYLVTGQGYEKNDDHKQSILLHDTFFAANGADAELAFKHRFEPTHKIMKIYSATAIES